MDWLRPAIKPTYRGSDYASENLVLPKLTFIQIQKCIIKHIIQMKEIEKSCSQSQRIIGEHSIQILEISDEEIEKCNYTFLKDGTYYIADKESFYAGAKWYREKIKQLYDKG